MNQQVSGVLRNWGKAYEVLLIWYENLSPTSSLASYDMAAY